MTVNYSGGNGEPIASTGVTGLTAILLSGTLANGTGSFTYQVQGTPSASSPNLANFELPATFGGSGCSTSVGFGGVDPFAIGEVRSFRAIVNAATFIANGGSRSIMNGKAANNITTINRQSAYELSSAAAK